MIYFIIAASIIAGDAFLKEYFKSSFRGKHRKEQLQKNKIGEEERINGQDERERRHGWRSNLAPSIELLENTGAASGILSKHPKILKGISACMLCICALVLGRERRQTKVSIAGIGYAFILGGGLSNFIDRVKKGSVTDYLRFPNFPIKKIRNLVFNLSDFGIFAGVFCLLFRKK